MQQIIAEFQGSTLFYSLLAWSFLWLLSVVFDKYRQRVRIDEKNTGLEFVREKLVHEDKMKELKSKLDWFTDPVPKYFYLDSAIIELLYSMREFQEYSRPIFRNIVELLDRFLKFTLYCDHYPTAFASMMHNLIDLKKEILNQMHAFIYNLQDDEVADYKLSQGVKSMHQLLNFHLEYLRTKNNIMYHKTGPNVSNQFVNKLEETGFDLSNSATSNALLF